MEKRLYNLLELLVSYNTESPPGRNTDPLQDEIEELLKALDLVFNGNNFIRMIVSLSRL